MAAKNKKSKDLQKAPKKSTGSDFKINLEEIPNGTRKPLETCLFLEAMRNWRAESAQSKVLIR
ncbi:MAG: hypothetical protein HY885_08530 [Deltaproteobacteria bacterium]|jgi:hypothetical protein|nr:hypothetical protein [Deltaproteobacteria bacterium]